MTLFLRMLYTIMLAVLFSYPCEVATAKPKAVKPGHVKIILKSKYKGSHIKQQWIRVCEVLGKALSINSGLWNYGIFDSFSCYQGRKLLPGRKKKGAEWTLEFRDSSKKAELRLYFKPRGAKKRKMQTKVVLAPSTQNLFYLADYEVAEIVAWELLDALPMIGIVDITKKGIVYLDRYYRYEKVPEPIKSLNIQKLSFNANTGEWKKEIVGTAELRPLRDKDKKSDEKLRKKARQSAEKIERKTPVKYRWKISMPKKEFDPGRVYYLQDISGPGTNKERIHEGIELAISKFYRGSDFLKTALFSTFASGYGGFRLGLPLVKGDSLLSKALFYGILTEVRGGPVKGLRFYMDFSPEVTEVRDEDTFSFGWSRYSLAWSIGLELPYILKRIDIVPKIGLLNFNSSLGVPSASDPNRLVPSPFELSLATSFGIELSIEYISPWFLVRGWIATDQAGLLDITGTGTVNSSRAGLDAFFDLFEVFEIFEVSAIAFVVGEQIRLQRNVKEGEEASDGTEYVASGVSYNLAFIGGGLTFTW